MWWEAWCKWRWYIYSLTLRRNSFHRLRSTIRVHTMRDIWANIMHGWSSHHYNWLCLLNFCQPCQISMDMKKVLRMCDFSLLHPYANTFSNKIKTVNTCWLCFTTVDMFHVACQLRLHDCFMWAKYLHSSTNEYIID